MMRVGKIACTVALLSIVVASSDAVASDGALAPSGARCRETKHEMETATALIPANTPITARPTRKIKYNDVDISSSSNLNILRGGDAETGKNNKATTTNPSSDDLYRKRTKLLRTHAQTSFLILCSTSVVAFAPLPSLTRRLVADATSSPQAKAVKILSVLTSIAAAIELFLSPLMGVLIDNFGRKRPSIILHSLVALANGLVVLHPGVGTILLSRTVNVLVGGFLVIVSQAVIADMFSMPMASSLSSSSSAATPAPNENMGSVLGLQAACVSLGFLFGSVVGGRLTEHGERLTYGVALVFSTLATLNVAFRMWDSLKLSTAMGGGDKSSKDNNKTIDNGVGSDTRTEVGSILRNKILEAPLSSVRLFFGYGSRMRTLALLMMLQTAPNFSGDIFQLFAREEWGLHPKGFADLVAVFGIIGIFSNISLPFILQYISLRTFSLFAILSAMFFPLTVIFGNSHRHALIAGCIGLYGACQQVGTKTAMTSLATELGAPQGQLQGEKASMLALLKITVPLVYGMLYLKGKAWVNNLGTAESGGGSDAPTAIASFGLEMITRKIGRKLPFVMNVFLGMCAFAVTWQNL